ncbi:LPXTG-motif cell wall anchor domain protein [Streptomyces venezuelae]|nr:LPXTG-motif cell wall anchor domain protein [Streptomyces venezuelae]CUM37599.1 FIG01125898: hypothetical protein [Streptomyces venezuelae]
MPADAGVRGAGLPLRVRKPGGAAGDARRDGGADHAPELDGRVGHRPLRRLRPRGRLAPPGARLRLRHGPPGRGPAGGRGDRRGEPGAGGATEEPRAAGGQGRRTPTRTPAPPSAPQSPGTPLAPRTPLTPPSPPATPTGPVGSTATDGGAASGSDRSGPLSSGTSPGADPRSGHGAAPRDPGGPGLTPPTAAGGTFGGARPEATPFRPGTSGPGTDALGTDAHDTDARDTDASVPDSRDTDALDTGERVPDARDTDAHVTDALDTSGPGGPVGPRAVEPGSEWFGTGPTGRDDHTPGARDVPPGARAHRTFAERYPAHIPLPPTAPRPEPVRGAFRPVTIRTARDAVAAAAGYLRWLGFRDVVQPEDRPASGVDLRAPGLVAQVDPSTRPAGLRAVECLWLNGLSTPATSVSVFFSLAGYTPEARERAAEIGLPLFVLDLTGTPQPVNHAADELAAAGA